MIKLRAHHILCLHGFRGYGYNDEFVSNMQAIYKALKDNPQLSVMVTDLPDDICAACPNLSDGCCAGENGSSEISINRKDAAVMARLCISPGDTYKAGDLFWMASDRFTDDLGSVCSSCKWFDSGWCEEGLRNKSMSL